MTAASWLEELARRRVVIQVDGGAIRIRAPRGALSPAELSELRERKEEIVRALSTPRPTARADVLGASEIEGVRETVGAVLLASPRFGQVWLARDESVAAELRAEQAEVPGRQSVPPIFTFDEVPALQRLHPDVLRAVLTTRAVFPGSMFELEGPA